MRKPFIAGNWKMYKTVEEAVLLAKELASRLCGGMSTREAREDDVDVAVCPNFVALAPVAEALKGSPIGLGAQDIFWEKEGAFTGEVSAGMIRSAGAGLVIVGHSERRHIMGETDEVVARKLKAALSGGLAPILCVGERAPERQAGKTHQIVERQVKSALFELSKDELLETTIAYEPVWAIGTGETATPEQAQEVHALIREILDRKWGGEVSGAVRIQYGGSVKPENVDALMARPDIDGALVGGASLKADAFERIVRFRREGA